MKIEPVGCLSTHNVEGPFKLQFHKTREEIYTDTCLRIDAIYTEAQLRQLGEACVLITETEFSTDAEYAYGKEIGALLRELIKGMLP